jgi:hypothetical protein
MHLFWGSRGIGVVNALCYKLGGRGFVPDEAVFKFTYSFRGPLSLVTTIEELLERKISGSSLETREYGRRFLPR